MPFIAIMGLILPIGKKCAHQIHFSALGRQRQKVLFLMRLWVSLLAVLLLHEAQAQTATLADEPKKFAQRSFDDVVRERTSYQAFHFSFPNINRVFDYQDPAKLKKIMEMEQQGKFYEMKPLLENYVGNFGVRNFYKDTRLLWRMGQLYEKLGENDKARSMYRLVLKHQRSNRDTLIRYYDKVNAGFADNYVPLKFYYELVEYRKHIDTLRPPREVYLNMGEGINSRAEDYAPALTSTDDSLIFSSKRNKLGNRTNEDLFYAQRDGDYWLDAKELTELNSRYNEGSAIVSRSGRTMIFTRCDAPDGYGNCDLYTATWDQKRGIWTDITNMGTNINGRGWDSQPALSVTEDTLYFASNRLGGFGMSDIWFSVKDKGGKWGIAQNLGPVINTRGNEASPFLFKENNVLYFASDSHIVNFGNFDIYKAYFRNGRFQEPKNIGPLVNGGGNEYYFTIDSKARKLYYARSEDNDVKNLEIFSFALPMEAQPKATTVFSGQLTDEKTGKPFAGIVSVIDLDNGIEVAPKFLRPDGSFDFDLIKDNNYLLIIQGDEFFRIEEKFYLKGDTFVDKKTKSIKNIKISFPSLEFLEASADILPSMYEDLNNVRNFLLDNPDTKLRIEGHTDQKGNANDNLVLSRARAESIKAYLMETGQIKTTRITALGMGSTKPIIPAEKTDTDRKINRRVEFTIIPPKRAGDPMAEEDLPKEPINPAMLEKVMAPPQPKVTVPPARKKPKVNQ